ncbi:MAG: cob(I)yrinic acid a,c-diamide adenosyltransferase [Clostridiales bacterium]|jgi:cob(I)alamin adenosyltransferase|nr:cob(I)yrinic acid a,c-diamide adenosyltransferase [Clostridiales bacterium]
MRGLVHIYTGNGKGKTTTAVGLGIRAYGAGLKVLMVQFLKGSETGELEVIKNLAPGFKLLRQEKIKGFIWNMNDEEKKALKSATEDTFKSALEASISGEWEMLIMDEIMGALSNGLISEDEVVNLIKNKSEGLEVVMTGRNAPKELVDLADYVSEIQPVKHPFEKGIPARRGIEF